MNPLISIIIPTYNRAHLIGETITSIQNQTYTHWECIIIDDGSTDDTENLILKYIKTDSRIAFYKKPKHLPKGPSAARNYGFTISKGDFINWFDSDDLIHPKKMEIDLRFIKSGDYDFTISQSKFFNNSEKIKKKLWNKNIWSENPLNDFIIGAIGWGVNTPLWRKSSLSEVGLSFDEDLMTADDYDYHIKAILKKLHPIIIDKILVQQREHPQRLNDFRNKAPYKLKVNLYLMSNKTKINLNSMTINHLKRQYYNQIITLLKNKNLKLVWFYLRSSKIYEFENSVKRRLFKNFMIGFFYKIFGLGYKLIN